MSNITISDDTITMVRVSLYNFANPSNYTFFLLTIGLVDVNMTVTDADDTVDAFFHEYG